MGPTTIPWWQQLWPDPAELPIEAQRRGNCRMPLAFDVGGIAVERHVERHSLTHVEADTPRRIPHFTRVAGAAAQLDAAETIFIAAVERVAAESLTCLRNRRPPVGVVSDVAAIVHGKFDAGFSNWKRDGLQKR